MWRILMLGGMLAGCVDTAWDMPQAEVTAVAAPEQRDAWDQAVTEAVSAWDTALADRGCDVPFTLSESGKPIRLVPRVEWSDDSTVGNQDADGINIRSGMDNTPPRGAVLLHELGHAMGLQHTDPADGPSVMTSVPGIGLAPRDIEAAVQLLGC